MDSDSDSEINTNKNIKNTYSNSSSDENLNYPNDKKSTKKNKIGECFENFLGSKLILNNKSNMLIIKPYLIFELLDFIKNSTNTTIKIEIIDKLIMIIEKLSYNSSIIIERSKLIDDQSHQKMFFMDECINILIENNRDLLFCESVLNLLQKLIYYSGVKVEYFWKIFEKMSNLFSNEKTFDGNKFLLMLKILNKYLTRSINDGKNFPQQFFFFNNLKSELKVESESLQNKNNSIVKGYTIGMWIYLEKINLDATNKRITDHSTLFYIHTNKFVAFEATLKENKIYYRWYNLLEKESKEKEISKEEQNQNDENNILNNEIHTFLNLNKSQNEVLLTELEYNKWTFLLFTHKPMSFLQKPQIVLYKNGISNPIIKNYEYPNVNNQKISSIGICKDFTGLLSNVFMLNECLSISSPISDFINYPFGLYNEKTINEFIQYINQNEIDSDGNKNKNLISLKNVLSSLLFMYSPCRTKGTLCIDLIDNINAEMLNYNENNLVGGVFCDNNYSSNLYLIGGISIFLPIFEFIFNRKFGTPMVLEEAINILLNIFDKNEIYDNIMRERDKNFFSYLGLFIKKYKKEDNNSINLFTHEIMVKLISLTKIMIKNDNKNNYEMLKSYCQEILLNPKLVNQFEQSIQIEFWKNIYEIYQDSFNIMYDVYDASDFLELITKLYDNNINIYCCDEHYKMLCEKMDSNGVHIYKLSFLELLIKINHLLNIIKMILSSSSKEEILNQMKKIIKYLSLEISPCLIKEIIYIFQNLFGLEIENKNISSKFIISEKDEYIECFIRNGGVEHILYILTLSTLDNRYECLKILNLLFSKDDFYKYSGYNIKEELIPYICTSFFPLKTPLQQESNNNNKSLNDLFIEPKESYDRDDENIIQNFNFQNKKSVGNLSSNSLNKLEDDYWNIISDTTIIQNLSLPISYVHEYSNPLNDNYVDKIYNYLICWLMGKFTIPIELDDNDDIIYEPILNLILQLIMYSGIVQKHKFLTDLYTLTQFNRKNCEILLKNKYFYQWLLDLMLTYQIINMTNVLDNKNVNTGLCDTILNLCIKLHSTIFINSVMYEEEKYMNQIIKINFYGFGDKKNPKDDVNHGLIFNYLMTWMYKIRLIGDCEREASIKLIHILLFDLVEKFNVCLKRKNLDSITWKTFQSLTIISYEFALMSNFDKDFEEHNENFENIEKNEIISEIIQRLNYDYSKKRFSNEILEENEKKVKRVKSGIQTPILNLWEDKSLLINIYNCYKDFWSDTLFSIDKDSLLLDEIKSISILINSKVFNENPNVYAAEMKILLFSNESNYKSDDIKNNNILKSILNILMILLRLSDNKDDISNWIRELEKFILFLVIASQGLSIDTSNRKIKVNEEFLLNSQENVLTAFITINNFLLEELNSPRRKEFNNDVLNEFIYCIRTLFITYTVVVEKILKEIENEKSKDGLYQSLMNIFNNIKKAFFFVPQKSYLYSPINKIYNEIYLTKNQNVLFTLNDISEFRLNNYLDIPQKFNDEDWIYAFQDNPKIYDNVKNSFSLKFFHKLIKTRLNEAKQMKLNQDICYKEKNLVDQVYTKISNIIQSSLENNENLFLNECYYIILKNKENENKWKKYKKSFFTWKGKWINEDEYLKLVDEKIIKFKIGNHFTKNYNCPLLYEIFDIWNYLPNFSNFKTDKLFLNINNEQINLIMEEKKEYKEDNIIELKKEDYPNYMNCYSELRVQPITNKSFIYYKNNNFSDIVEIYHRLEKIIKYFQLFYTQNFDKCIIDIGEYYLNNLKKSQEDKTIKSYNNCCLLKKMSHLKGKFILSKNSIHFIIKYPYLGKKEKCNGSLFDININKEKIITIINLSEINHIFKRRYYYKKNSFEIYTITNKSYYFIFENQTERDEIFKLISHSNNINQISYPDNLVNYIKEWENWSIDNFSLINILNNFSGRSYKDLTQYPIFPWIIKDYENKQLKSFNNENIRDLKKPIGALGNESRILYFIQRFSDSQENQISTINEDNNINNIINENDEGKYYYSSHYSNPFYVSYYLIRLFPFSSSAIELQGNGFDKVDRQFNSLIVSFHNCMNETTDIRELIPEIFYLPELFLNINQLNFGSDNKIVKDSNCILPNWSKNNPYLFIIKNRLALESDYVSKQINNWIDLIFGYKQKGEEAIKAMNLFFHFTYEDAINIDKYINNKEDYDSLISKIDIGQTPSQIINKPFIQRLNRNESKNSLILFENLTQLREFNSTSEHMNTATYKSCRKDIISKMIIHIKSFKNNKILCVFNNGITLLLKADNTPYSESGLIFINEKKYYLPTDYKEQYKLINSEQKINIIEEDNDIMKVIENNQPIIIIRNGKYIIKGGFFDSKFMIYNTDNSQHSFIFLDNESRVTNIITDNENEKFVYIGTSTGRLFIYSINQNNKSINDLLIFEDMLNDHNQNINYMFCDTNLNVFSTVSSDKTCNIYTYPLLRLFRVIKPSNQFYFDYVFISNSPLPSIILYCKKIKMFYVYSINGGFIIKKSNKNKQLYSPKVIKDNYHRDYLFFGTNDGCIIYIRLPLLDKSKSFELKGQNDSLFLPIKCFDISEDRQTIYYWRLENFNLSAIRSQKELIRENKEVTIFDAKPII